MTFSSCPQALEKKTWNVAGFWLVCQICAACLQKKKKTPSKFCQVISLWRDKSSCSQALAEAGQLNKSSLALFQSHGSPWAPLRFAFGSPHVKLSVAVLGAWVLLGSHPGGRSHCHEPWWCQAAAAWAPVLPMAKQKELEVEGRADVAWSGTRDEKWKNSASELVVMGQGSSEGASAWSTRGTYWMGTNREDGNLE